MGVVGSRPRQNGRTGDSQCGTSGHGHRGVWLNLVRSAFQRRVVAREYDSALQTLGGLQRMIELAFGAAHPDGPIPLYEGISAHLPASKASCRNRYWRSGKALAGRTLGENHSKATEGRIKTPRRNPGVWGTRHLPAS